MHPYHDCVIFLLAKAYQRAHAEFKRRLQPHGLTPIQHLILEVLWRKDGLSASEIGKLLVLDGATLSGVLERLAAGGWIEKAPDPDDRRVMRNHLTEKSRRLKLLLVAAREETNAALLAGFSLEEKVVLKRLLRDLQEGSATGPEN